MSESTVYLIPQNFDGTGGAFARCVRATLEELCIIDGYYDDDVEVVHLRWFAAGDSSGALFKDRGMPDQPAFAYAIIHGSDVFRFIPDTDIHSLSCAKCEQPLDEEVNEVINEFYDAEENGPECDMRSISITCPYCDHDQSLEALSSVLDREMTNQYINFCRIDGNIDEAYLTLLEEKCGCTFKLIYERY